MEIIMIFTGKRRIRSRNNMELLRKGEAFFCVCQECFVSRFKPRTVMLTKSFSERVSFKAAHHCLSGGQTIHGTNQSLPKTYAKFVQIINISRHYPRQLAIQKLVHDLCTGVQNPSLKSNNEHKIAHLFKVGGTLCHPP